MVSPKHERFLYNHICATSVFHSNLPGMRPRRHRLQCSHKWQRNEVLMKGAGQGAATAGEVVSEELEIAKDDYLLLRP